MFSLNYSLSESLNYYLELIKDYDIFYILSLAMVILGFILIFNINHRNNTIITIGLNMLAIFLIFNRFGFKLLNHLDSCLNQSFLHNICFYYINTILALIIAACYFNNSKVNYGSKVILIMLYLLMFLNLSFALYISYTINLDIFIVLGNIYPMILIGNLIAMFLYLYVIVLSIILKSSKYYDKKKHLLYN